MKKKVWSLIFISILILSGIVFFFLRNQNNPPSSQPSSEIVLFYGQGCLHCVKVEEFIEENKIKEKIAFQEKEVFFNKKNAEELVEKAKKCGLSTNEIGVPFLWDGAECFVGDVAIINFFKEKINL